MRYADPTADPVDPGIFKKYAYMPEGIYGRAVLFFDKDITHKKFIVDYEEQMSAICDMLGANNVHIYIKPHPRMGYSKFLNKYCSGIIPAEVPGEFIDTDRFQAVLSVYSLALLHHARNHPAANQGEVYGMRRIGNQRR